MMESDEMSIRSIDLQMLVPRSHEQSKINQNQNDKVRIDNQQIVQNEMKNIELQLTRVNSFEGKKFIYSDNKENKRRENEKRKKNKKNDKDENKEGEPMALGSNIDIKI